MHITAQSAMWFLPFVLPLCIWTAYTDLRYMLIKNYTVLALLAVFVGVGFFALPFDAYLWRLAYIPVAFAIGFAISSLGLMGAGDAKFLIAAAPYVAPGDGLLAYMILMAALLFAWVTHRLMRASPIRRMTPDWKSWDQGKKFPMGYALGMALAAYLALGIAYGS